MKFQKKFDKQSKNFNQGFKSDFITEKELGEFRKILRNHNFQERDFEFFGKEDRFNNKGDEFTNVGGLVSITFKPTGKQKNYRSGNGNKWTFEFQKDLHRGFFQ